MAPELKPFPLPVKLVSADGSCEELKLPSPLNNLMLIPKEALKKLEAVASSSRDLLAQIAAATADPSKGQAPLDARAKLQSDLDALANIWDIPKP